MKKVKNTNRAKKSRTLSDEQLCVCRSAARQVYKLGGYCGSLEDLYQDAVVVALKPRGRREPRTLSELYWKVFFGLIDEHRARTGSRWLKRHNKNLNFLSLDEPFENSHCNNHRARAVLSYLEERRAEQWSRDNDDHALPFEHEGARRVIAESALNELVERKLRESGEKTRKLYCMVYQLGLTYKEVAEIVGVTETMVAKILARFRRGMKDLILSEIGNDDAALIL